MSKEKSFYIDKPLLQRIVLFLTGFSNFLISYAHILYLKMINQKTSK